MGIVEFEFILKIKPAGFVWVSWAKEERERGRGRERDRETDTQ